MNTTKLTIQWIFVALLFPLVSTGSNTMSIPPVQVGANQTATIQIKIDNDDTFVGFQADIPLPGQFSFVTGSAQLNTLRSNGHVISANQLPGNILRLIAYSLSNSAFLGDTGMVAQLDVQAATVPGWYALYLNNAIIGDTSSVNILTSAVSGSISLMASDINLMSSELNFGEIPLLQTQSKSLTIQNTGNQTLEISAIQFDSPWFSVNGSDSFNVLPGASQTITLVFDSHVKGTYSNTINIFSNDPDEAIKSAQLNAFAFAVNELHTGSAFAYSGDLVEFSFSINNMDAFTGFQFDVVLPPVMTYVNSSAVLSQRSNGHMASASMVASNTLRVVAYSINNSIFSGVLGDVISLSFFVNGTGGYYPLSLSNVIIGDTLGENVVSDYFNGQLQIAAADIHGSTNIAFGEVSVTDSALISWSIYNIGTDTLVIENIIFTTIDFYW